jgi:hypothetical protein
MVVVVMLHWLSVMPALVDGKVVDENVVAVIPGLWPLTWAGDVMACSSSRVATPTGSP